MSIRDIIAAATPGPWDDAYGFVRTMPVAENGRHVGGSMGVVQATEFNSNGHSDSAFIATFDPDHVALMEAVVEAVDAVDVLGGASTAESVQAAGRAVWDTRKALAAYRKERAL